MYKSCFFAALAAVATITLGGCSGNAENADARSLFDQAQDAFKSDSLTQAIVLLDSLQKSFPDQTSLQREVMVLRPQVIEADAVARIALLDSTYNADMALLENLKPKLKWIKAPEMIEGYWVASDAYKSDFMNTTGVEARVSEVGEFYLISSVNPAGGLHHQAVGLKTGVGEARTPIVPFDGESNYRIGSGEVITFSPEQSAPIGTLALSASENRQTSGATLMFYGTKRDKTVRLTDRQVNAFATAYAYSSAVIRAREAQVERERLKRTADIAHRQFLDLSAR